MSTPTSPLDCGNSGSTIRMLAGLLAGQNVGAVLAGDESLQRRPMKRVADPLREMGAELELTNGDYAPLTLIKGTTRGIAYTLPVSSAQVKSAVLLAGLRFSETKVIEPQPTRDHTERLFEFLGVKCGPDVTIPRFNYTVPGDPSSAAFLVVHALMKHKSGVIFRNVLNNPLRNAYLKILQDAGAIIEVTESRVMQNEPVADFHVHAQSQLHKIVISPEMVPALIDEIPALAVAGISAGFELTGAKELRYKESDRIRLLVENFRNLGLSVDEWDDGFRLAPGSPRSATVRTGGDHRIAMAFAAAGFAIDDEDCVKISFPEFFEYLKRD
jgi:3-phosphoshikimate 1-carboxyvinyltransferase